MTQPKLGVCYYPEQWPESMWAEDARSMREHGISLVRIGEFAWSRIEPRRGTFDWDWLDRAINTLADAGLHIVLGTPTATPPQWLIAESPEVLPVGPDGKLRGFGSRRHYSFSSETYRNESRVITRKLAERYATNKAVVGWQLDNEYGCHDTTLCYSDSALAAFRRWLAARYASIDDLNTAWGNVFWSQEYLSFDDVGLPLAVTETNPAHRLAFRRFSSDQVKSFSDEQAAILREHCGAEVWLTHNFMGNFTDFDHYDTMANLDVASWDSYPLGFLDQSWFDETDIQRYRRTGHPDWAAFHHDLYRGVGRGRFGVMEQQPGAVNWAAHNAQPHDGMVRLWSWEAIAHGAEFVSWFRWRQAPFAQEQMHAGLKRPDDLPAQASAEVMQLAGELAAQDIPSTACASVALIFDYSACWVTNIQPQCQGYSALALAMEYYTAVRSLGLDVDIVAPGTDLSDYALVVLPCNPIITPALCRRVAETDAQLLIGPRAGSKTDEFSVSEGLPPGRLQDVVALRVTSVDSMRAGVRVGIEDAPDDWFIHQWLERIETKLPAVINSDDDRGVLFNDDGCWYVAGRASPTLLQRITSLAAEAAGLQTQALPGGLRLRRRGSLCFAFNYDATPHPLPAAATRIIGGDTIAPHDVAVWQQ